MMLLAELLTLTVEVDERGNIRYCNQQGQVHRVHGPAIIYPDGTKGWLQNDLLHRTDGPAIVYSHGGKSWYLNGDRLTEEKWNEQIRSM